MIVEVGVANRQTARTMPELSASTIWKGSLQSPMASVMTVDPPLDLCGFFHLKRSK
jgi:hypothetical protein